MEIKILFDSVGKDKKLRVGWGFSCLIDNMILFDTGEKGEYLLNNIKQMHISIDNIKHVVISHDHWDHTGGLWELLKNKKELLVYVCAGFSREFKENVTKMKASLVEIKNMTEIQKNIFSTGEIKGTYNGKTISEQALVIKTKNGISIITGCAHPGILKIIKTVKVAFPDEILYLIMGGFHLIETDSRIINLLVSEFKKMEVKKVGPTHCSGNLAEEIFKVHYSKNFLSLRVGETLEI